MGLNKGDSITKASEYYELAAKEDVIYAMHMTVLTKKILAIAGMQIIYNNNLEYDLAIKDWEDILYWAEKEVECLKIKDSRNEKITMESALENLNETKYYLALCYYNKDDFAKTMSYLENLTDSSSKILQVATLLMSATNDNELASLLKIAMPHFQNNEYDLTNKIHCEEQVYGILALQLSSIYKDVLRNMDSAVELLTYALNKCKMNSSKQILQKELNRYQRKLFGGYKYI